MKIALLGSDPEAIALLAEVSQYGDCQLTAACQVTHRDLLAQSFPGARILQDARGLLASNLANVVVVCGDEPLEDSLRLLAKSAVPLLVMHPSGLSILGFELEMIRKDLGTCIASYSPETAHAAARALLWAVQDSSEPLDQIVMERTIAATDGPSVRRQFARDALLIRMLMGEVSQLSAMGSMTEPIQNLTAQMTNADGTLARWSLVPSHEPGGTIAAVCGETKHELSMPQDLSNWQLITGDGQPRCFPNWTATDELISRLQAVIEHTPTLPDWENSCRGTELAELLDVSARRGRTIHIYNEEHSEESTFKGMMAAGGCLLMLATLVLLMIMVTIESLEPPFRNHILWRLWPAYLLAPFSIFLLLQTLKLLFPKQDPRDATNDMSC